MNSFDDLFPDDGFRVIRHDMDGLEISLHVGLYVGGELQNVFDSAPEDATVEIWSRSPPQHDDYGARQRVRLVAEAICRFLNAGGTWDELLEVQNRMQLVAQGPISIDGWRYMDGYVDTEGNFTHVFLADDNSGRVVRWVEGEFIDTDLTLHDLAAEMEEDDQEVHSQQEVRDPSDFGPQSETDGTGLPALLGPDTEG